MRAAIYARVSTEAQEARGTVGSQLDALRQRLATEHDEVIAVVQRALQTARAVGGAVDREALRLEPSRQKREDPRLVLDDQDPHLPAGATITQAR